MGLDIIFTKVSHPRKQRKGETLSEYLTKITEKQGDIFGDFGYFRKVNCIYRYFADRLENEECIVTKEDVLDVIQKAANVLSERNEETSKSLLPTQDGFFFGSTDYDDFYYQRIGEVISLFGKMLSEWEDDSVVFVSMSW